MNETSLAQLVRAERTVRGLEPVLGALVDAFDERGAELYLVGGSVRDALLGRLGNDLDFTTDARPETVKEIMDGYAEVVWETGIEFGTVSGQAQGQQIEITTFRSDLYDGDSRNPEVTFGDTLEGDLVRRDFTVNAMAIRLTRAQGSLEVEFCDPVDGLKALAAEVLDTPNTPEQSFRDDPLRMLRCARFVSQLGFKVAPRVREALENMAGEITRITPERIQVELDKLIGGQDPSAGIDLLVETGLGEFVFPEIGAMKMTSDEHKQHKDVYLHSLQVMRQAIDQEEPEESPDLVLRWAALLHDVGKPDTKETKPGGGVSFHHHEVVGAKKVRRRLRKLKYPKKVVEDISQLVYLHMRFHGFGDGQWTDSAVRRYVTDAGHLLPRLHKLVRADSTTRNPKKAARLQRTYDHLEERIAEIAEKEDLARVRPDLDGNEIMEVLGLSPGPEVGKAWAYLKELRLERGPLERDEAIAELKSWWAGTNEDPRLK
ncbi:CCA tRNA nucleotidyltransferase [Corynebacterium yudongzhengii]|uniref:CCA tRNA nucleotidyltransferase n=1 Tax=Corynebacterium yudongzhengii TaxID=2080740 RepID=A0A2U1T4M4_9CORY|nr:CCA tRNA nucleotidyltransferase [Corynebacterium yudongzhengii]AWB82873.1 CCA tRNA nucleotidyltransferase [Corynebacterium yudongzhengii]PWC00932.1 CCA tRNA nucleotidyltransferase [Corynebacterium yudongzhengii]